MLHFLTRSRLPGTDPVPIQITSGLSTIRATTFRAIVMQVKGGKEVTLNPGETFYEGPEDVHVVGRNASGTKPAKFLVFLFKDKGAPILVPAN